MSLCPWPNTLSTMALDDVLMNYTAKPMANPPQLAERPASRFLLARWSGSFHGHFRKLSRLPTGPVEDGWSRPNGTPQVASRPLGGLITRVAWPWLRVVGLITRRDNRGRWRFQRLRLAFINSRLHPNLVA